MSEDLEERITELEIRFSHQNRMLDELNQVLVDCDLRIERLDQENRQLRDIVKSLQPELQESPDE